MDHNPTLCTVFVAFLVICKGSDTSESPYGECGYQSEWVDCPGTAYHRIDPIHLKLKSLKIEGVSWKTLRKELVSSCGLIEDTMETSHCFADWTHVDCCPVVTSHAYNTNEEARIANMHQTNQLGPHITRNSIPIGDDRNGSWCTCPHGAPLDVCHLQMGSMIAFKLIWCPFMAKTPASQYIALLVDNSGNLLNHGNPTDQPSERTKEGNWNIIVSSQDDDFKHDMLVLCDSMWRMIKKGL